jgi:hypothetical protein
MCRRVLLLRVSELAIVPRSQAHRRRGSTLVQHCGLEHARNEAKNRVESSGRLRPPGVRRDSQRCAVSSYTSLSQIPALGAKAGQSLRRRSPSRAMHSGSLSDQACLRNRYPATVGWGLGEWSDAERLTTTTYPCQ